MIHEWSVLIGDESEGARQDYPKPVRYTVQSRMWMNQDIGTYGTLKRSKPGPSRRRWRHDTEFIVYASGSDYPVRWQEFTDRGSGKVRKEAERPSCRQSGYSCLTDTSRYLLHVVWLTVGCNPEDINTRNRTKGNA
jgi:hypothetical protein